MRTIILTSDKELFDKVIYICRNMFCAYRTEHVENCLFRLCVTCDAGELIDRLTSEINNISNLIVIDSSLPIPSNRLKLYQVENQ
jgi:hypothetical protein